MYNHKKENQLIVFWEILNIHQTKLIKFSNRTGYNQDLNASLSHNWNLIREYWEKADL